jgi:hypothetical protein
MQVLFTGIIHYEACTGIRIWGRVNWIPYVLKSALQIFERNDKQLLVFYMALESFLKEIPGGVYGVILRERKL